MLQESKYVATHNGRRRWHLRVMGFAILAATIATTPGRAEEIRAEVSQWRYFDGYNPPLGCFDSDSAAIAAKLANIQAQHPQHCPAEFAYWDAPWPNTEELTSFQEVCIPPEVPQSSALRRAHKESRYARYKMYTFNSISGSCQPPASNSNTNMERQKWYYCADPQNFDLVVPAGSPANYQIPVCRRKATSPNPRKQPTCTNCSFGNPIDAVSGDKIQRETDYVGDGPFPLTFTRWYRGFTLSHSYQRWLDFDPLIDNGGYTRMTVWAERADGRAVPFTVTNTDITFDTDTVERLERVLSGTTTVGWRLKLADDSVENYDVSGRLTSITTRSGLTQTLSYDSLFRLTSVSDSFGRQLTFGYDSSNRLTTLTDPAGGVYHYDYNVFNRLTGVTYPDSTSKTYLYNEPGRVGVPNSLALTGIIDESNQRYATFEYDSQNRAVTTEHAGGADRFTAVYNADGTRSITDAFGVTRTYTIGFYQGVGKLLNVAGPVCNNCGLSRSYSYGAQGNLSSQTDFRGTLSNYGYTTDGRNLQTQLTEANGTSVVRITTVQWHPTFRVPTQIDLSNRRTVMTYDTSGNMLTRTITDRSVTPNISRTWTYTYNSNGQILTEDGPRTDATDVTTYSYYNCTSGFQCGQLNTITNALGHVTTFNSYNAHGQPIRITDPNGLVTSLGYDARKRMTDRCVGGTLPSCVGGELTHIDYWPTGLLKKVTNPDGSYVEYLYDAAHRLTEIKDGALNRIVYTLDAMGNRVAENVYDPSNTLKRTHTRVFNTLNQFWKDENAAGTPNVTTVFGYDDNSNLTSTNAPLSRNSSNTYDELDRLKQITDPNGGLTKFAYNVYDQTTSVTDPRNKVTSYTYNVFGDLKTQTSPDTGLTTNTYDSGGNLDTSTDARGAISDYSYDAANRVTSVSFTKTGVTDQTINFGYDAGTNQKGRLTSAWDANHSLAWTYDAQGRVTGKGQTVGTTTLAIGYGYNAAGQLGTITLPSGNVVTYGYDANGRVTSLTLNGATTILSGVTYDPFGDVTGWTWGNGTSSSRVFDADGKITQVSNANGISVKNYAYDDAFRITGINDDGNSALSWTYGYDVLDRLNSATSSSVTQGWTYDANGNRLTQSGTTPSTYSISTTSNRVNSISGSLSRTYGYDAAGNTLSYAGATFTFNNRGRMAAASNSGVTATYVYNALGQRVKRATSTDGVLYLYDEQGRLAAEYTTAGAIVQETVWLGDKPIATLRSNGSGGTNLYFVHTDHLNAPRIVTDTANNTRWRWDSDAFGNTAPNENPAALGVFVYNLRFPGQQFDPVVGLNYNYFRDYDASTGRYSTSDPIGLRGGTNTYAYAANDAISSYDPLGLMCTTSQGFLYCTFPTGNPTIRIPTRPGFPDRIGDGGVANWLSYHQYIDKVPLDGADRNCVMQKLIEQPTPGTPKPATEAGTRNNAEVFGVDNMITSFLTKDINTGGLVVVNMADSDSLLSPGYVMRYVSENYVYSIGEGHHWSQAGLSPVPHEIGNWYIWKRQMQRFVEECKCKN